MKQKPTEIVACVEGGVAARLQTFRQVAILGVQRRWVVGVVLAEMIATGLVRIERRAASRNQAVPHLPSPSETDCSDPLRCYCSALVSGCDDASICICIPTHAVHFRTSSSHGSCPLSFPLIDTPSFSLVEAAKAQHFADDRSLREIQQTDNTRRLRILGKQVPYFASFLCSNSLLQIQNSWKGSNVLGY